VKFKALIKFIPATIWMLVIFYFSSRSTTGVGYTGIERFLLFKTLHLIEYGLLAVLIIYPIQNLVPTIFYSYLYAISDEIHQYFTPGRGPKFTDTLIDLLGIIIGLLFFHFIRKSSTILHKSS